MRQNKGASLRDRATHERSRVTPSPPTARIPSAAKWLLLYSDNSERLEVSYDLQSHWGTDVRICTNDSSDWEVRIDAQDLRWLAARLLDAASAIEVRRTEPCFTVSVHESAGPQDDAQTQSEHRSRPSIDEELIERLRALGGVNDIGGQKVRWLNNPNGPEAADRLESLLSDRAKLEEALEVILTPHPLRDTKWAGMTLGDIARFALRSTDR